MTNLICSCGVEREVLTVNTSEESTAWLVCVHCDERECTEKKCKQCTTLARAEARKAQP